MPAPAADPPDLDRATIAVLSGRGSEPGDPLNSPPIFASTFRAGGDHDYARAANPTWEAFEAGLGALEGGEAVAFGSGLGAAAGVLDLVPRGGAIVSAPTAYVEVRGLFGARAAAGSATVEYVDPADPDALVAAGRRADLVWIDAISNPTLEVPELDRILTGLVGAPTTVVVDATLATPFLVRPLALGADVVVHSATKFIGGHSDLLLGVAVAARPLVAAGLRDARTANGSVPGTMDAWLALRGLRTLPLRVERSCESAEMLAARLASHARVASVAYPGLPSHRGHAAASRVLDAYGAVVAFELADPRLAERLCERVRLITHAPSLGGVESLIDRPERWQAGPGVSEGLLRLSVGCEAVEDLWADLAQALDAIAPPRSRPRARTALR